ncbi:MAG: hypothetical protein H3C68_05540 [Deltaproteobacteria bacterium]|nr:hypothetical protein [Deltaproteobacteria bacterium]MBZ0220191.1 hypothetical protein [Deltaproteobacteria bacterium]
MPNISSETLFHFTRTFENLKGILKNEFHPRYSLEVLEFEGKNIAEFAYPMVCFCDIPLSQVKEHFNIYGNYGIGMSKEWVFSNGLNPVMYLKKGSVLSDWLRLMLECSQPLSAEKDSNARGIKSGLLNMLRYTKPFEGVSNRTGTIVKFYNEREWRYIPFLYVDEKGKQVFIKQITKKDYSTGNMVELDNFLLEQIKLRFDAKDIKYIIVKNEAEILEMVDYLHEVPKYNEDSVRVLTSRIITSEQIEKDF